MSGKAPKGGAAAISSAKPPSPKSSSQRTPRWRAMDSNPRSPCGGWRLGLLPRSYGKFRRPNCGSHLTPRWRERDSNPRSPEPAVLRGLREVGCGALGEAPPEDTVVESAFGATAILQLDLSCSACHSIEPGANGGGCRLTSLLLGRPRRTRLCARSCASVILVDPGQSKLAAAARCFGDCFDERRGGS